MQQTPRIIINKSPSHRPSKKRNCEQCEQNQSPFAERSDATTLTPHPRPRGSSRGRPLRKQKSGVLARRVLPLGGLGEPGRRPPREKNHHCPHFVLCVCVGAITVFSLARRSFILTPSGRGVNLFFSRSFLAPGGRCCCCFC